jgi:spermidine synthase
MKPRVKIATTRTPDGGEMVLYQHDHDFSIHINGHDLMHSRRHESELELARLGCAHLTTHRDPSILIGGLGMGFTLRQTLDLLNSRASVVVGELLHDVVQWNRKFLGVLTDHPLEDKRVTIETGDIIELISRTKNSFHAILLDIDNGPGAITDSGNNRLYNFQGMTTCRRALRPQGCLAVWSAEPSKKFEQLLVKCSFHVRRFRVPAFKGSISQSHFVYVASENRKTLPPGGGEPHMPKSSPPKKNRRRSRKY